MGKQEETMRVILEESFKHSKYIIREDGDEGFESRIGNCHWCRMYGGFIPFSGPVCLYNGTDSNIHKINGGEMSGGECYEFESLEAFWDEFSNNNAIDPETGEIFQI